MFSYNYKLRVVNPTKGVVSLTPTFGTYVKCFAPTAVVLAGMVLVGIVLEHNETKLNEELDSETPNS